MLRYKIEREDHVALGYFECAHGLAEQKNTNLNNREVSVFGFEKGHVTPEGRRCFSQRCIDLLWVHLLDGDGQPFITHEIQDVHHLASHGEDAHMMELLLAGGFATEYSSEEWKLLERWSSQMPQEKNQWVTLCTSERRHWLDACAAIRRTHRPHRPVRVTYDMDASHVTDYPSFFIAIGEAIHGPGGYFGRNVDALSDCLCGGFGATSPFTLKIRHAEIAQRHLTSEAWRRQHIATSCQDSSLDELLFPYDSSSLWDVILEVLNEGGIQTQLP